MASEEPGWKMCVQWLHACHLLPDRPLESPLNLCQALMDGTVLCKLVGFLSNGQLDPCSQPEFVTRPEQSQFLCEVNIRIFLQVCRDQWGIDEENLFETGDLYQAMDFAKVIKLLALISNDTSINQTDISGFCDEANEEGSQSNAEYHNLKEIFDTVEPVYSTEGISEYNSIRDPSQEKIYDTVVHRGTKNYSAEPKTKRDYCIREVVDTEQNYVDLLTMLIEDYKKPLMQVLSPQEIEQIFMYIEDLSGLHRVLLSDLRLAIATSSPKLHQVFLDASTKMLLYGQYCSHLQTAKSLVMDISKNDSEKKAKIESCRQKCTSNSKFNLTELLTVPMQRVLRYHLLLENLVKLTPSDHADREGLTEAHDSLIDLAVSVNEVKRDLECITAIDKIQESINLITLPSNMKLSDYGRRHIDGELKYAPDLDSKPAIRQVFVFDKMLLLCKSKGDSYSFKEAFHVINNNIEMSEMHSKKTEKFVYCFTVNVAVTTENHKSIKYFYTKSEELRQSWMKAIKLAVDNVTPAGSRSRGHYFEMTTFPEPTKCDVCKKIMRGMFFQGYRCANTNRQAHKECIPLIRPLPEVPFNTLFSPDAPSVTPLRRQSSSFIRSPESSDSPLYVKAIHNYTGIPPPPPPTKGLGTRCALNFSPGVTIEVIGHDQEDWLQGRIQGRVGWFPSSHVADNRNGRLSFSPLSPPMLTPSLKVTSMVDGGSPKISISNRNSLPVDLSIYDWYVGEMDRLKANVVLKNRPNGTYLVRLSKDRVGEYSLSVCFETVKHVKIFRNEFACYLVENSYFESIPSLIEYYAHHSLKPYFPDLNTTLAIPFRSMQKRNSFDSGEPAVLFYATVLYDYDPTHERHLQLRQGDRIAVTSRSGDDRGWWKGASRGKIGFFPFRYVKPE